jgi:hypothetical protein
MTNENAQSQGNRYASTDRVAFRYASKQTMNGPLGTSDK